MKRVTRIGIGLLLASVMTITTSLAQTATEDAKEPQQEQGRTGQVLDSESREGAIEGATVGRLELMGGAGMPKTLKERLQEFHNKREEYLQSQRELRRELRGATDEDRAQLREMIREQRQEWLEEAKKIREQARERMQQLRDELPRHQEMLDAAREQARERADEARERARERRGTD